MLRIIQYLFLYVLAAQPPPGGHYGGPNDEER